jgi:hypothetical protein
MPNPNIRAAATGSPAPEIDREREERQDRAVDRFNGLYAAWHAARAKLSRGGLSDLECTAASDAADEAARQFMIAPAPLPCAIWWKFEVLEFYMSDDGECAWTDQRHWVFLACIKADLMRFVTGQEE